MHQIIKYFLCIAAPAFTGCMGSESGEYQQTGGPKAAADSLFYTVEGIASNSTDKFAVATSPDEIISQFEQGPISLPIGIENGAAIGTDIENTHNGLSDFGMDLITEMNKVGMMGDVYHITDQAFCDVMDSTQAPVIATHSSCRHFTPGFERNISDKLIKRLTENDGVIMINFGSTFLDSTSRNSMDKMRTEISKQIQEKGWDLGSEDAQTMISPKSLRQYFSRMESCDRGCG